MICPRIFAVALLLAAMSVAGCSRQDLGEGDRSTPQKAAAALMLAIDSRDGKQVRESFAQEADRAYVDALVGQVEAFEELRKTVVEKYNKETGEQLLGKGASKDDHEPYILADRSACLKAATEINGDRAQLKLRDGRLLMLTKKGTDWKVLSDGQVDIAAATQLLKTVATSFKTVAAEVRSGTLKGDKDVAAKLIRARLAALNHPALTARGAE